MTIAEAEVEMPNVEGNYEEIVQWMNDHPTNGVDWWYSHGSVEMAVANGENLNFGLFSLNDTNTQKGLWSCSFETLWVYFDGLGIAVEDPENSHTLVF